jgi:hypothetical protein
MCGVVGGGGAEDVIWKGSVLCRPSIEYKTCHEPAAG